MVEQLLTSAASGPAVMTVNSSTMDNNTTSSPLSSSQQPQTTSPVPPVQPPPSISIEPFVSPHPASASSDVLVWKPSARLFQESPSEKPAAAIVNNNTEFPSAVLPASEEKESDLATNERRRLSDHSDNKPRFKRKVKSSSTRADPDTKSAVPDSKPSTSESARTTESVADVMQVCY